MIYYIKWTREAWIHLASWFFFITYEIIVAGFFNGTFGNFWVNVFAYTIYINLFYFHATMVLPYALGDENTIWWKVPFLILGELMAYLLLYAFINLTIRYVLNLHEANILNLEGLDKSYFLGLLFRGVYFLLLSTGYYFFISTIKKNKEEATRRVQVEQLRTELLQSELNHLRAQVNPHLLFNALSFIKYNTKHSPETAGAAIVHLAAILRFATSSDNKDKVLLMDEINQVNHLIELNRLRFEDSLNLKFEYKVHDKSISVLPLALLTLVENVFKHGNTVDKENPAMIFVETSAKRTIYKTSNLIRKSVLSHSSETGLKNIKQRLKRIYPDRFTFNYDLDDGQRFNVELCIWN